MKVFKGRRRYSKGCPTRYSVQCVVQGVLQVIYGWKTRRAGCIIYGQSCIRYIFYTVFQMVFYKVYTYIYVYISIYLYIEYKSGIVQCILKGIVQGILLVLPQGIVKGILQGPYSGYSIRYSVLFINSSPNKLRFAQKFPRSQILHFLLLNP